MLARATSIAHSAARPARFAPRPLPTNSRVSGCSLYYAPTFPQIEKGLSSPPPSLGHRCHPFRRAALPADSPYPAPIIPSGSRLRAAPLDLSHCRGQQRKIGAPDGNAICVRGERACASLPPADSLSGQPAMPASPLFELCPITILSAFSSGLAQVRPALPWLAAGVYPSSQFPFSRVYAPGLALQYTWPHYRFTFMHGHQPTAHTLPVARAVKFSRSKPSYFARDKLFSPQLTFSHINMFRYNTTRVADL